MSKKVSGSKSTAESKTPGEVKSKKLLPDESNREGIELMLLHAWEFWQQTMGDKQPTMQGEEAAEDLQANDSNPRGPSGHKGGKGGQKFRT